MVYAVVVGVVVVELDIVNTNSLNSFTIFVPTYQYKADQANVIDIEIKVRYTLILNPES